MGFMLDIDVCIANKHLLTHPFYLAWTRGTLPREALLDYARQYYAFESNLPRFLTSLHARSEDAATRTTLLDNAWDEAHGEANHPELWLRFAEALGVNREDVTGATPSATTSALVDTYWDAARNAPVAAGVAALYAYESQLPAVSDAKIAGLQAHYGITSGSGLTFFEVHRAIDVHHAAAERRILERAPATEQAAVVSSTERALESWWGFLSGFGVDDAACA